MTQVIKKKSFLKDKSKDEFRFELTNHLDSSIIEAYIFGSFSSSDFDEDSDLDLVIIVRTDLPFFKRHELLPKLNEFLKNEQVPCDLLVYTPEELEHFRINESEAGFWKDFFIKALKLR